MPLGQGIGEMWGAVRGAASRVPPAQRRADGSRESGSRRGVTEMPLALEAIFAHQEQLRIAREAATDEAL